MLCKPAGQVQVALHAMNPTSARAITMIRRLFLSCSGRIPVLVILWKMRTMTPMSLVTMTVRRNRLVMNNPATVGARALGHRRFATSTLRRHDMTTVAGKISPNWLLQLQTTARRLHSHVLRRPVRRHLLSVISSWSHHLKSIWGVKQGMKLVHRIEAHQDSRMPRVWHDSAGGIPSESLSSILKSWLVVEAIASPFLQSERPQRLDGRRQSKEQMPSLIV